MPASRGTDSGTRIIAVARATAALREVAASERHAAVLPLFAALTAAAPRHEEHAAQTVAPVARSCGSLVAASNSVGASWSVKTNLKPETSTRRPRSLAMTQVRPRRITASGFSFKS